jgi:hypothetical protein
VEADPGDRVRHFDVTELSQALSVRLGALLGIAATMINWTALWRHSMIGYPTAMLWRNKGAVGWRRASFVRAVAALRAPDQEKPPSPTGAVWSGPLAYNVLCCTQMRRERRRLHRVSTQPRRTCSYALATGTREVISRRQPVPLASAMTML